MKALLQNQNMQLYCETKQFVLSIKGAVTVECHCLLSIKGAVTVECHCFLSSIVNTTKFLVQRNLDLSFFMGIEKTNDECGKTMNTGNYYTL
jgi:hypothetical protein